MRIQDDGREKGIRATNLTAKELNGLNKIARDFADKIGERDAFEIEMHGGRYGRTVNASYDFNRGRLYCYTIGRDGRYVHAWGEMYDLIKNKLNKMQRTK